MSSLQISKSQTGLENSEINHRGTKNKYSDISGLTQQQTKKSRNSTKEDSELEKLIKKLDTPKIAALLKNLGTTSFKDLEPSEGKSSELERLIDTLGNPEILSHLEMIATIPPGPRPSSFFDDLQEEDADVIEFFDTLTSARVLKDLKKGKPQEANLATEEEPLVVNPIAEEPQANPVIKTIELSYEQLRETEREANAWRKRDKTAVGDKFREARERQGLSQRGLSALIKKEKKVDISNSVISKLENGKRPISFERIKILAEVLKIRDLLGNSAK